MEFVYLQYQIQPKTTYAKEGTILKYVKKIPLSVYQNNTRNFHQNCIETL